MRPSRKVTSKSAKPESILVRCLNGQRDNGNSCALSIAWQSPGSGRSGGVAKPAACGPCHRTGSRPGTRGLELRVELELLGPGVERDFRDREDRILARAGASGRKAVR